MRSVNDSGPVTTTRNLATPAAATVTVLMWASAFVVIRAVGETFSPGVMALLRMAFAVAALTVIVVFRQARRPRGTRMLPRGRPLAIVLTYGVAWFGGYMIALNWAEQHVDAGTAALLVNVAPIIVAVLATVILGEPFHRPLAIGIAVAFAGVVLITVGGGPHADLLGIGLGLLAAVLYASGVLLQKVALRDVDAVTATWLGAVAGLVATVPWVPAAIDEVGAAAPGAIAATAFLGIGPTAIAFITWAYALARTDAGVMAATTLVVPAIVIVLSWALLGELPTPLRIVGGALCLIGVAVSRGLIRPTRRPVQATTSTVPQP